MKVIAILCAIAALALAWLTLPLWARFTKGRF